MSSPEKSWLRYLGRLARPIILGPISPPMFAVLVSLLRKVGLLPRRESGPSVPVRTIFVAHPYSSLGDLVLLIPFLERLKSEWPDACIDVAVGDKVADLLSGVSGLRSVFRCKSDFSSIGLIRCYQQVIWQLRKFRLYLSPAGYDLSIAPRWGSIETWPAIYLAHLVGARECIGYSARVDGGDPNLDALLTRSVMGGGNEHETVRNLRLLSRAGLIPSRKEDDGLVSLTIPALLQLADDRDSVKLRPSCESRIDPDSGPFAVIAPGATAPFRIWPVAMMAQVIQEIHRQTGLNFLIMGGKADQALCDELAACQPACTESIAGRTRIRDLVQLIARAELFLGMDSGTAHIAGAVGIPTVVISPFPSACNIDHPNSPRRFRPCGPRVRVLQPERAIAPCFPSCLRTESHCIKQVTVEEVVQAVIGLLNLRGAL